MEFSWKAILSALLGAFAMRIYVDVLYSPPDWAVSMFFFSMYAILAILFIVTGPENKS